MKDVHVNVALLSRFDIVSLSPDAAEDESGIKRAAENSEFTFITTTLCYVNDDWVERYPPPLSLFNHTIYLMLYLSAT